MSMFNKEEKDLVNDAKSLAKDTKNTLEDRVNELRGQLDELLDEYESRKLRKKAHKLYHNASERVTDLKDQVRECCEMSRDKVIDTVKERPLETTAAAFTAGVVLGAILAATVKCSRD